MNWNHNLVNIGHFSLIIINISNDIITSPFDLSLVLQRKNVGLTTYIFPPILNFFHKGDRVGEKLSPS